MKNKSLIFFYFFFSLIYFNQGIYHLPSQALYYLMRENWGLSVAKIAYIGALITIPWAIKPIYGVFSDFFPLRNSRTRLYLIFNYISIVLLGLWVFFFGLNILSLILIGIFSSIFFASSDVFCDTVMVQVEQKYNLQGKGQSVQWFAIGIAGLITSIGGAYLAKYYDYKLAYLLTIIIPILTLLYIVKYYKEEPIKQKKRFNIGEIFKPLKNKQLLLSMLFLFCFYLSPSFGVPLMTKMREIMGIDKMFIGLLGTVGTTFGLVGYILYYFKVHKMNLKRLLYISLIYSGLSTLCYLYLPNQWILLGYNIIFGTIGAIIHLIILAYCAKITPKGSEGFTFALIMSILNLGSMGSSALGGFLYSRIGYNNLVIISALFTFLCLIFIPKLQIQHSYKI